MPSSASRSSASRRQAFSPIRGGDPALDRVQDAIARVLNPALDALPSFADAETPDGVANGTNREFLLARLPSPAASLQLFVNGVLQVSGVNYSLAPGGGLVEVPGSDESFIRKGAATITFASASAPATSAVLRAWYRY